MRIRRSVLTTCLALYLFGQLFFLIGIQFPRKPNFDEFHYVPSAKQFLALKENQNWEHPPLAKEIMAGGIALLGDQPAGWRLMSTFFGALTLVGMYLWGLALFRNERSAVYVALITLVNQFLYVQSRIGMLDTFMMAFLAWGLAAFFATQTEDSSVSEDRNLWLFTGVMMGLATACKWFAVIPWAVCGGLALLSIWQKPDPNSRSKAVLIGLIVVPVLVYFATFLPFLSVQHTPRYTLLDFLKMQKTMYEGQLRVVTSHPYMSQWTSWPWMTRPIWYAFDKEDSGPFVRGVLLLGNPLIMWGGLLALAGCVWGWVIKGSRQAFLILTFYAAFALSWAIIPRKIAFYYYYYPAAMILSLAITYLFDQWDAYLKIGKVHARWIFLAASLGLFIYFFPILAGLKIPADSFRRWMWLSSWI